ncbi:MAG: SgcJ/EcaC family oxidoreductase [Acidobacteria bacterium]|nr:SgcJ/EcaC family oxidoreductase [Acidobacteriota bacterium]
MRNHTRNRRLLSILAALFACALNSPARAAVAPSTDAADEAAVRENVRQMEIGWNTKSGALYAKPFAADADFVIVNGTHLRGREAIEQSHQRIFDTFYKNSTLSVSVKQIRFLRPDVAVVHVQGVIRIRQGEETRETNSMVTLVMTKEKGDWKIVAFQNTRIDTDQPRPATQTR